METEEKIEKIRNRNFSRQDLPKYIAKQVPKHNPVVMLEAAKWTQVDDTWIFLKDQASDLDSAYAQIVVKSKKPLLMWPWLKKEEKWVQDWDVISGTRIIITAWYVGDGTKPVFLAAATK